MHANGFLHVSIECLQAFIAIAKTHSFTSAAAQLGISQPGISARIRKIEEIVGGAVLTRSSVGWEPTAQGKKLYSFAERIIDIHKQIAWMGGASAKLANTMRIGICDAHASSFIRRMPRPVSDNIQLKSGPSAEIGRMYDEGYLDLAWFFSASPPKNYVKTWRGEQVWACAPGFSVPAMLPVPLVLDAAADQDCLDRCNIASLAAQIVFDSKDLNLKIKAVAAGLGVTPLPRAALPEHLLIAEDQRLPPLPSLAVWVCCRKEADLEAKALAELCAETADATPA